MARGIEGLAADLGRQEVSVGPGAYQRVLVALREHLAADAPGVATLRDAWADREFHAWYARPLLLLASMRYRALADDTHPLVPEVLMDAAADGLEGRLSDALLDPELPRLLTTRSVTTNDPSRAIGWGVTAWSLGLGHRGFVLVDIGTAAGLNLVADLIPASWRVGSRQVSGLDLPSPVARVGLDRQPLDVADPDTLRWLRACVWPGDADRRQRLEAAVSGMLRLRAHPGRAPELRTHDLGTHDTAAILADLESAHQLPVLAFQSVVRDYLPPAARKTHEDGLRAWLAAGGRRVFASLETAPPDDVPDALPGGPAALEVMWAERGDVRRVVLARTAYHPRACHARDDAAAALRALGKTWQREDLP